MMRALVWIVAETWQATVAAAAAFLPADADVTLLYVRSDAETVARGARSALLGRSRRPAAEALDVISEQGARNLLADAQAALGRQAALDARAGRIEHEVVAAVGTADLLVFARDQGHAHRGPRSLGPTARYVVDHAPCAVLLVWPDAAQRNRIPLQPGRRIVRGPVRARSPADGVAGRHHCRGEPVARKPPAGTGPGRPAAERADR
jgi:nucleotide-binding universal stress UspA family protein